MTGDAGASRHRGGLLILVALALAAVGCQPPPAELVLLDVAVSRNRALAVGWVDGAVTAGAQRLRSVQAEGRGRDAHLLVERFGPVRVSIALVVRGAELHLVPRRWAIFGLPLPRRWLPGGTSFEAAPGGTFRFDVEYRSPLTGPIARYRGWLKPETEAVLQVAE